MPELPEVELERRALTRWCVGKKIRSAWIREGRPLDRQTPQKLRSLIVGQKIEEIERRGKQLIFWLSGERNLLVHLGMTGSFERLKKDESTEKKSVRLLLGLEDGSSVAFFDPRKFSKIRAILSSELESEPAIRKLGPDVMNLKDDLFYERLQSTSRPIKIALMDQSLFAGIGNIYSSEGLFRAKIHPSTRANALSKTETAELLRGLRASMRDTIRRSGLRYLREGGENTFKVYGRAGEICPRCKQSRIEKTVADGRSTFWCPSCQASRPKS